MRRWSLEKDGIFSVKSMNQKYCGRSDGISSLFVNIIWQAKIPKKVKVFSRLFNLLLASLVRTTEFKRDLSIELSLLVGV